ncbi:metal/formaldehyde-sensitive transcriptional repressor [Iodobacter sp.]|uniref:metal/formaldehyde-sensitive transcriptional repressor n=1 Tax=Iodobacter sp. TaxID=1915058 RepID=UPI0025EEFDD1|nr:metal/formaldehyde-sensitive transcriptional repressor [Iodobacter sp.]
MTHTNRDKAKLLTRVRRIQGQATALEKQLNEVPDCIAILQQIAAIRGAVNGLMTAVIEGHLTEHIVQEPDLALRQKDSEVLLQIIKSYLK